MDTLAGSNQFGSFFTFVVECVQQGQVRSISNYGECRPDGTGSVESDYFGHGKRLFKALAGRADGIGKPYAKRLRGIHLSSGKDEIRRGARPYQPGEGDSSPPSPE